MEKKIPVIQLDYYTGEIIGEYESILAAAQDNWLTRDGISKALRLANGNMKKKKMRFMYK